MKNLYLLIFTIVFSFSFLQAQDSEEDAPEISTVEALLLFCLLYTSDAADE